MWTPEHRLAADRSGLRYPSDLTDAEWAIVQPMIPLARHGGLLPHCNLVERGGSSSRIIPGRDFAGNPGPQP